MADPVSTPSQGHRQCVICGGAVTHKNRRTRTCGKRCGKVLSDRSRSQASTTRRTRQCECCGTVFVMRAESGRAMAGKTREGRFCSRACSHAAVRVYESKADKKRAARRRKLAPFGVGEARACDVCGRSFIRTSRNHSLCSDACRSEHGRRMARHRAEVAGLERQEPRPCRECGEEFTPAYGTKRRVFCSDACGRRFGRRVRRGVERARLHGVAAKAVDAFAVFERDGWRCYICGIETPRHLRGTWHSNAPELDHIIPLMAGGEHSQENTACCCRACNHAKGDGDPTGANDWLHRPMVA